MRPKPLNIFLNTSFVLFTLDKFNNSLYISFYLKVNWMVIPPTLALYFNYVLILSIFKQNTNFFSPIRTGSIKNQISWHTTNSSECEFATQWLGNDSNIIANISATDRKWPTFNRRLSRAMILPRRLLCPWRLVWHWHLLDLFTTKSTGNVVVSIRVYVCVMRQRSAANYIRHVFVCFCVIDVIHITIVKRGQL